MAEQQIIQLIGAAIGAGTALLCAAALKVLRDGQDTEY
jgi:gas vesicle protein